MILRQLEYLTALAGERHFGRAAAACHVSQPALSTGIRKLERELGVTLVRRSHRYDTLTPEGEVVVAWAQRIMADVAALNDEASQLRGEITGTLRLGVIPMAMPAVALITRDLLIDHPGIHLDVRSMPSADIVRLLAARDIDGGINYLDDEPLGAVKATALYEERYFLLKPGRQERSSMLWAELKDEPLCLLTRDMQSRRIIEAALNIAGVVGAPRVEANNLSGLLAFAQAGYPTVIAHTWLALHGLPEGMGAIALESPDVRHTVGLITSPAEPPAPLVRTLRAELADAHIGDMLDAATDDWLTARRKQ